MSTRVRRDEDFGAYVTARRSRLVGIAYLLCGDRHAAEDLVQTTLAKLYVVWPRVHRNDGADAYVRRMLVNANIDAHRRPWRREHSTDLLPETAAQPAADVADRDELIPAVASLAPKQRKVVVMRFLLGLTVDEVAAELQVTAGTVKSQTSKALTNLRSQLTSTRHEHLRESCS